MEKIKIKKKYLKMLQKMKCYTSEKHISYSGNIEDSEGEEIIVVSYFAS